MNPRSLPSLRPCSKAFNFADRESPRVTLSDARRSPRSVAGDEIQLEVGLPDVTAARGSHGNSNYSPSVTITTVGVGSSVGADAPAKEPRCATESFYPSSRRR